MNNKLHGGLKLAICIVITVLFCYFRLKPVLLQTVGYTYDQGRDFLKAAEIVLYKNPTFIGPTTGIGGVFHGAWWYYILSVAFIIFDGLPIGFYLFNVIIQGITAFLFFKFTKRLFGFLTSAILSLLLATSGHFIFTSIFIGNNVYAIPSVFVMAASTILLLSHKKTITLPPFSLPVPTALLAGLGLGFIAEFEFAFGLMAIPSYFLVMGTIGMVTYFQGRLQIKHHLMSAGYVAIGLVFPFIPRFLFELKNQFPQTRILWNFLFYPSYHTPKPYESIWNDRVQMFQGFYNSLFISDYVKAIVTVSVIIILILTVYRRKFILQLPFIFICGMLISLFMVSTVYKDTFWSYYYDGIQILMLLAIGYLMPTPRYATRVIQYVKVGLLTCIVLISGAHLIQDLQSKPIYDGIQVQRDIVSYIQALEKPNSEYCVQIYTPPVIPYTYEYLFLYAHHAHGTPEPKDTWVKKQCWFIIEYDENNERKDAWITSHIPEKAARLSQKQIKDVSVELWKNVQ